MENQDELLQSHSSIHPLCRRCKRNCKQYAFVIIERCPLFEEVESEEEHKEES